MRYLFKSAIITIILLTTVYSGTSLTITPSLAYNTFTIPFSLEIELIDKLTLYHQNSLFQLDAPHNRFVWYNEDMSRNEMNAITDYSYLQYGGQNLNVSIGRQENTNVGRLSDLFLTPQSPALDQINVEFTKSRFYYRQVISRLDNQRIVADNLFINRWLHFRRFGYHVSDRFSIAFQEMMVVSGENRALEWYYLNPFSLYLAEEIHEQVDDYDSSNGFLGFDWQYSFDSLDIYNQWIFDEFQIDAEDRKRTNDVFGTLLGFSLKQEQYRFVAEYAYASPWLYIHHGIFTSPERHGLPLGLRAPHSQSIDVLLEYRLPNADQVSIQTHLEWRGTQSFDTEWDPIDNKIDYFDFDNMLEPEFKLQYQFADNPYLDAVSFYHNWMQSDFTTVLLSWEFRIGG